MGSVDFEKMFLSPGMLVAFQSLHETMSKHDQKSIVNVEIILTSACLSLDRQNTLPSQAGGHFILAFEETNPTTTTI